jgi:O-antigen/teichoic acid export membrane protein
LSKVVSAGKSVLLGSFLSKGISILGSVVLARLLIPDDYGALVLSMVIAGLIQQLGSMGFELYYLQFKGSIEDRLDILEQVFNLRLVTNILLGTIQFIIGIFIYYYSDDLVTSGIILFLSFSLIIEGFNSPQETLLKDDFEFKKITLGNVYKELISTISKLVGAYLGFGGLVFGIGPFLGSVIRLIYLKNVVDYKPRYFNWKKPIVTKPLFFGLHNLLGGFGLYLIQQADKIFLSTFFDKTSIGYYSFSWSNASILNNYIINPQGQVILSFITKYKPGDSELFYKLNLLMRLYVLIVVPLMIILGGFLNEIVILVFTEKWIPSISLIQILLIYFTINIILSPFMPVLTGLGFSKINTKQVFQRAILLVPSLFLAAYFGLGLFYYLIIFISINILFELIKVKTATNKMGVTSQLLFKNVWVDFLVVFITIISILFFKNLTVLAIELIVFFILFLDFKKTKSAFEIGKKVLIK